MTHRGRPCDLMGAIPQPGDPFEWLLDAAAERMADVLMRRTRGVAAEGGLVLAVSGCGTTGPTSGSSPARIHTVKGGETLWRISRKYDTSVAAITRANGLKDPTKLAIGQKLRIPAGDRRHHVAAAPSNRWMTRDARGRRSWRANPK